MRRLPPRPATRRKSKDETEAKYYDINTGVRLQGGEFNITMNTKTQKDPAPGYCFFDGDGWLLHGWQGVPDGKGNYLPKYFDIGIGKRLQGERLITMNTKTEKDPVPGWCFFDGNGVLLYGWQGVPDGKGNYLTKYYDTSNGKGYRNGEFYVGMKTQTEADPAPGYRYFNANGVLLTDAWTPNNYYYDDKGIRAEGSNNPNPSTFSGMNNREWLRAHQIFDVYNQFRASKGLSQLGWWNSCEKNAWESVVHCASVGKLEHAKYYRPKSEMTIPDFATPNKWSDILQYATWEMKGIDAVNRWSQSDGHRKMMQCDSAVGAAVACYNNGGTWYYAIVYCYTGQSNQSGS